MKQIGEFAKDNNVTIKALHHYEKLKLIAPFKVDEVTGYRYYDESQRDIISVITYLKTLGLSLSEVKKLLDGKIALNTFISFLCAKKKQAEVDINSAQLRYHRLSALINALESKPVSEKFDIKEILKMDNQDFKAGLTGHELFNYATRRMMESAVKENASLCALAIDIDDFASVNDEYGYEVGDVVIERIQNAIESALIEFNINNKEDYSIMERDAGDEFKIVVSDSEDACKKLASDIIEKVNAIDYGDVAEGLTRTVTIGIASNKWEKLSTGRIFHLANSALYEAKSKKRGIYKIYTE
jgi:diguanylate cyclase (GGDEF)-like protein